MSDHVIEWLNAYHDGELKGMRLHRVEDHLSSCEACRREFDSLRSLSTLLRSDPAPRSTPVDRFVSNVNLLLPKERTSPPNRQLLEVGWWLIPIGLLTAWIFFSTAILVSEMISAADTIGWLDTSATLLVSGPSSDPYWLSALGRAGILGGIGLQWAESAEAVARNVLPQFVWQVSIALLYLAWMAVWWARRTRQVKVPLLEG